MMMYLLYNAKLWVCLLLLVYVKFIICKIMPLCETMFISGTLWVSSTPILTELNTQGHQGVDMSHKLEISLFFFELADTCLNHFGGKQWAGQVINAEQGTKLRIFWGVQRAMCRAGNLCKARACWGSCNPLNRHRL